MASNPIPSLPKKQGSSSPPPQAGRQPGSETVKAGHAVTNVRARLGLRGMSVYVFGETP